MKHRKCGTEIEEWKNQKGAYWHRYFVGRCPLCDVAVTKEETEE